MSKTVKKKKVKPDITYKNKDVTSKLLAERFKNEFFNALGLELPAIVRIEPTNLPAVEANELQMDNLFLLEDGSYIIVDYESVYSEANKLKYLGYVARLTARLYNEHRKIPRIGVVVIYTADVVKGSTDPHIEFREGQLSVTEVFLSEIDADTVVGEIKEKMNSGGGISDRDIVCLIVSPLAVKGNDKKAGMIKEAVAVARIINDKRMRNFIMRCMLVFTNKVISKEDSDEIRRKLDMVTLEDILIDGVVRKTRRETRKETRHEIAAKMIRKGDSLDDVSKCTGLALSTVRKIATEMKVEI